MTEGPFVYGVELKDAPTAPTDISQYDLLFGPGSILHRRQHQPRRFGQPMPDYDDQYYAPGADGSNLSLAFGDVLRENVSTAIVEAYNLTGGSLGGTSTVSTLPGPGSHAGRGGEGSFQNQLIIPLYAIIFLLSVVGNLLVILTLAQNKRMRTVTNVYLLNLAISDLLLGVFCMPFTLAGQVLRRFVFGSVMCKLIPYFQAVSVSVAVWTLVAISLERYFAICRPLSSRRWQTQFHAYKMIALVWTLSLLANSPLCYVQRLQPVLRVGRTTGQMKCREVWPDRVSEKAYVLFHDVGLLFLPLLTMGFAYSMIVSKLWRGLRHEIKHSSLYQQTSRLGTGGTTGGGTGPATSAGGPVGSIPGSGGEQHGHTTGCSSPATASSVEGGKTSKSGYLLTSSIKKTAFKTSSAAVNFASNNNTISKGSFNGASGSVSGGSGGNTASNGAGSNTCSGGPSGGSTTVDRSLFCTGSACENRTDRLRGFRHFFAKQHRHHGGLCRKQRYHLGGTAPEALSELAETKFDGTPTHQQQQQTYHHHYHHQHTYHHPHHRIPTTIVKSSQQDTKHEIVLGGGESAPLETPGELTGGVNETSSSGVPPGGATVTNGTNDDTTLKPDASYQFSRHAIRSTYMDKSIEAKKKVIRMLFVIIVEFFVCWAPLHILNTVYLYSPSFVYQYVSSSGIALVQLMAYISSCCNPITYCFMNRRFRQAFLGIFSCYRNRMPICCCFCCVSKQPPMDGVESKAAAYLRQNAINHSGAERNNSDVSGNDSLVYVGRGIVQRSEILILESEDRV
ncbi:uncharacterized protein LOC128728435 [Anopheles nili]|uniref:uncharacterized protein LOC128728435 n=1 Tax=Anopheles nili TaxID=185578 RepID=UPI00237BF688|nr:uncharacterized protein LOC128728435 [Anopheles nili]